MGYGDIPRVINGVEAGYKEIFAYDSGKNALVLPAITLMAGYGVLEAGQAIALNGSSGGNVGKYFPYDPTATATGAILAAARIRIVADGADSTAVWVTKGDSNKADVGDNLYAIDADTAASDLGLITAIDTTTYQHVDVITVTSNLASTYTVAGFAYVMVKGYDVCKGILKKTVDTGTGSNAKGAVCDLVVSNAILYSGALVNVDAAALVDLSATAVGQYTILK